jgi:hypothetical protein
MSLIMQAFTNQQRYLPQQTLTTLKQKICSRQIRKGDKNTLLLLHTRKSADVKQISA